MIKGILTVLGVLLAFVATADERILSYHSEVQVHEDASLTVTETITVRAELIEIRRGIYRDIPSRYRDRQGRRVNVPIDVISVTRDGRPEQWHTESIGDGIRIYVGSADHYLSEGQYTYVLSYTTTRQVGFFDAYDEIYWNATGNAWGFPIDQASATIRLPSGVRDGDFQIAAYTGYFGDAGRDVDYQIIATDTVTFNATRGLAPGEGMTVAVGFPKGIVTEPSQTQKNIWFLKDNLGLILAGILFLATLGWYIHAWRKVGRDPAPGAIYPRYEAPKGYSPGMLRYVWKMGYDTKTFAAALVSMATQGCVDLKKKKKKFTATRAGKVPTISSEAKLFHKLLSSKKIVFEQSNHAKIRSGLKAHEDALSNELEGRYFNLNRKWITPGIILSVIAMLLLVILLPGEEKIVGLFLCIFLTIWSAFSTFLVIRAIRAWRDVSGVGSAFHALFITLFTIPFAGAAVVLVVVVGYLLGVTQMIAVILLIGVNVLFYQLLKAPTPEGRQLLDEIEGLRLYLGVAERDDIESTHGQGSPPLKTFEQFEKFLAFAIALDCADTWAEQFTEVLEQAQRSGQLTQTHWYGAGIGRGGSFTAASLTSGLSSGLSSAVSSSSTAPGSSSGSSGGGFSGGGGGGGGGGGW